MSPRSRPTAVDTALKAPPEPHASYHRMDAKPTVVGREGESLNGVAQVLQVQSAFSWSEQDALSQSEVVLHKERPALGEYRAVREVTGAHNRQFLRCWVSAVCLGDW
jgi:hypothetical protein